MVSETIRALTFDTGGTILDWHTGFSSILKKIGQRHGLEKDWPDIANQLRKRSLEKIIITSDLFLISVRDVAI